MGAEGMAGEPKQGPSRPLEGPALLPKWDRIPGYTMFFLTAGQYQMVKGQGQKQRAFQFSGYGGNPIFHVRPEAGNP